MEFFEFVWICYGLFDDWSRAEIPQDAEDLYVALLNMRHLQICCRTMFRQIYAVYTDDFV